MANEEEHGNCGSRARPAFAAWLAIALLVAAASAGCQLRRSAEPAPRPDPFAAADVASYQRQVEAARAGLDSANLSFQSNLDRIRDAVGLPIELIQAIRARTDSQNAYSRAISDLNRAQYRLYHAIGQTAVAASGRDGA